MKSLSGPPGFYDVSFPADDLWTPADLHTLANPGAPVLLPVHNAMETNCLRSGRWSLAIAVGDPHARWGMLTAEIATVDTDRGGVEVDLAGGHLEGPQGRYHHL